MNLGKSESRGAVAVKPKRVKRAKSTKRSKTRRMPIVCGWRELVHLPQLGIGPIVAKLDTGARTAALHAEDVEIYYTPDGKRVRFNAFIDDRASNARHCDLPLTGMRRVKNTGGVVENRAVVTTRIRLGDREWSADVTLTDRTEMGVPMLLGRTTIKKRLVVHPGRTFVLTREERTQQKTGRGNT